MKCCLEGYSWGWLFEMCNLPWLKCFVRTTACMRKITGKPQVCGKFISAFAAIKLKRKVKVVSRVTEKTKNTLIFQLYHISWGRILQCRWLCSVITKSKVVPVDAYFHFLFPPGCSHSHSFVSLYIFVHILSQTTSSCALKLHSHLYYISLCLPSFTPPPVLFLFRLLHYFSAVQAETAGPLFPVFTEPSLAILQFIPL